MKSKTHRMALIILPIVLVVLISGCSSSGPVSTSALTITRFEPDTPSSATQPLEAGESFGLLLDVKNDGEPDPEGTKYVMRNLVVELFEDANKFTSGQPTKDSSVTKLDQGDTHEYLFSLRAPTTGTAKQIQDYTIAARVHYSYQTDASRKIKLVDKAELKRRLDNSQELPLSEQATTTTKGPLTVVIGASPKAGEEQFIKVTPQKKSYTLPITIKNTGNGVVARESAFGDSSSDYKVDLTITGADIVPSSDTNGCRQRTTVKLSKGEEKTLQCEFSVNNKDIIVDSSLVNVHLAYNYYTDTKTTLNVARPTT